MATIKATIRRDGDNVYLVLISGQEPLEIILTDDNPNNIKAVFNKLLKKLKSGIFEFELEDHSEDLYKFICQEYINQLNEELKAVHKELEDYLLLDDPLV